MNGVRCSEVLQHAQVGDLIQGETVLLRLVNV